MTYRDDHQALGWRVEALEKELAEAQGDHAEVLRLRASLAAANAELARLQPRKPRDRDPSSSNTWNGTSRIGRRRWLIPVVLASSILPIAGVILLAVFGEVTTVVGHADGTIISEGGKLGTWQLSSGTCGSRTDRFGGVNIFDHDVNRFRFIIDAHGTKSITVFDTAGNGYRANEPDCATLDGTITEQPSSANRRPRLQGSVTFDCTIAGGRVHGSLTYKDCR